MRRAILFLAIFMAVAGIAFGQSSTQGGGLSTKAILALENCFDEFQNFTCGPGSGSAVGTLGGTTDFMPIWTDSTTLGDSRTRYFLSGGEYTKHSGWVTDGDNLSFWIPDYQFSGTRGTFLIQQENGVDLFEVGARPAAGSGGVIARMPVGFNQPNGNDNLIVWQGSASYLLSPTGTNNYLSIIRGIQGSTSPNVDEAFLSMYGFDHFLEVNTQPAQGGSNRTYLDFSTPSGVNTITFPTATGTVTLNGVTGSGTSPRLPVWTGSGTIGNSQLEQTTDGKVTILEGSTNHNTTLEIQGSDNFSSQMQLDMESTDYADSFFRIRHSSTFGRSTITSGGSLTITAGGNANNDTFNMIVQGATTGPQIRFNPIQSSFPTGQMALQSRIPNLSGNGKGYAIGVDPNELGTGTASGSNNFFSTLAVRGTAVVANLTQTAFEVHGANYTNHLAYIHDPVNPQLTRTNLNFTTPTAARTQTFPDATGTIMLTPGTTYTGIPTIYTANDVGVTGAIWGLANGFVFEGTGADAFEATFGVQGAMTRDKSYLMNDAGSVASNYVQTTVSATYPWGVLTTLESNNVDVVNSVWGASNSFVFEGSSADDNEGTLTLTNPTADRTWTLPNASGTIALHSGSLTDDRVPRWDSAVGQFVNSTIWNDGTYTEFTDGYAEFQAWGTAHQITIDGTASIIFWEGATADAFEGSFLFDDLSTSDVIWHVPDWGGSGLGSGNFWIFGSEVSIPGPDQANGIWVTTGGFKWEGALDANEGFLTTASFTGDRTWTLPDATGTVMLTPGATNVIGLPTTYASNDVDVANSVWGGQNTIIFEGSSADAAEAAIFLAYNPAGDHNFSLNPPNVSQPALLFSDFTSNAPDVANSVWGTTGGFRYEGSSADNFEGLLTSANVTSDRTWTLPDATGTIPVVSGTPSPAYGEIHVSASAGTNNTSGTPLKAQGTTTLGHAAQFDMPANNRLRYTGATTTIFECQCNISATSDTANVILEIYLADNGTIDTTTRIDRKISTAGDVGAMATGFIVELAQNEHVELWLDTDTGNPTITVDYMTLRCSKVN